VSATVTLSRKFQLYIPKAVREQQQWQAGQELAFIPKGGGVLLMPVPDLELEQLAGIAKGARKEVLPGLKDVLLADDARTDQLAVEHSRERGRSDGIG